jgi:hypothetical protein
MTMKKPMKRKSWSQMTTEELTEATKEFDAPSPPGRFRPMNKQRRKQFEASRRSAVGRRKARATSPVVVHLDEALLHKSESFAAEHDMTLSVSA